MCSHHCWSERHVQNVHENNMLQFLLCCKNLVNFLNFHELLMKQVLKVLNHLAGALLSPIFLDCVWESRHICAGRRVFLFLTFTTHSFCLRHHNSEIIGFQPELNSIRIVFQYNNQDQKILSWWLIFIYIWFIM